MSLRYRSWCIPFKDLNERDANYLSPDNKTYIELTLAAIFYRVNLEVGERRGRVSTDHFFLLCDIDTCKYVVFIKLHGENAEGYSK